MVGIVRFLAGVLCLGAGMISLSAGASMGGDIIFEDCGEVFLEACVYWAFSLRIPPLYPDPVLDLFGFSLSWCFVQQ
jgi:hypothetical protein